MIKRYELDTKKKVKKTRLLLMSDIHISSIFNMDKLKEIIQLVKKEKVDYVCLVGDVIDGVNVLDDKDLEKETLNFLKELGKNVEVIISLGNHDLVRLIENSFKTKWKIERDDKFLNKIRKINNVHLLDNELYSSNDINFIGFTPSFAFYDNEDTNASILAHEMSSLILKIDPKKYNILLCHSPVQLLNAEVLKTNLMKEMDLLLSGHMHNGLVPSFLDKIWKGNRGIVTPNKKFFPNAKMTRGIVKKDDKTLIISGGITKFSYSAPHFFQKFDIFFPMNIEIIDIQ